VREHADAVVYLAQTYGLFHDLPPDTLLRPYSTGHVLNPILRCLLIDLLHSKLPLTASAANTSGFLLVYLSKTPRIEILLRPKAVPRGVSDQG